MRLSILDRGHSLRMKAVLKLIGVMSGAPAPDVVKTLMYRPEFFGKPMGAVFQEAMRGPSDWSVAEREMMASYVSKVNECEFWTNAHAAVAAKAWQNDEKVQAVLADVDAAPIDDKLRATLKLLRTLTKQHAVTPAEIEVVLATGVTKKQIEDAFAVCFAFNVITRLADTFEFHVGPRAHFDIGAKMLLTRGYR